MQIMQRMRLNTKITATLVAVLTLAIASMVAAVSVVAERRITDARTQDLHGRSLSLLTGVDGMHHALDDDVIAQLAAFKADLGPLRIGASGELLIASGDAVEGRTDEVDRIATNPGANATVFEKHGTDFVRITTSVLKSDGSRAVGTPLAPDSPAYATVSQGRRYVGRADLFGKTLNSVYEPITVDGRVVGILYVGRDIGPAVELLTEQTRKVPVGKTGYFVVLDHKGVAQVHPSQRGVNLLASGPSALQATYRAVLERRSGEMEFTDESGRDMTAVFDTFGGWNWTAVALVPTDELVAVASTVRLGLTIGGAVLLAVLVLVLRTLLSRLAIRPLQRLADEVGRAEHGDLSLSLREQDDTRDEVVRLESVLARTFARLRDLVQQVHAACGQVDSASQEIRGGTLDLSTRTEEQAASLQETASSMQRITGNVRAASERAAEANRIAQHAGDAAGQGGRMINDAVASMSEIATRSRKVQDITSVIDGIAFQTNILALNAAVEAARAGETGKGFAVVAGEVRALARRSAEAAREIKALIDQSATQVDRGVQLVTSAGQAIDSLVHDVRRVAVAIEEISGSSAEQLGGIEQVNAAVVQLDAVTQQNAALVEQASAATQSLADQARALSAAVSVFKLDDSRV